MKPPLSCSCGKDYWPSQAWMHKSCVANSVVNVANEATNAVANKSESERVKAWREKNRERYNERERERMRKKRAKPLGIAYG